MQPEIITKNKKRRKFVFWLAILSGLILPFQNCSVYKSGDSKLFEEQGQSMLSSHNTSKSPSNTSAFVDENPDNCSDFLTPTEASDIFEHISVSNKKVTDPQTGQTICIFSVENNTLNGEDTAICSISSAEQTQLASNHSLIQQNSFVIEFQEYTQQTSQGSYEYHALGAEPGSQDAIHCYFVFASLQAYSPVSSKVKERALNLLAAMAPKID